MLHRVFHCRERPLPRRPSTWPSNRLATLCATDSLCVIALLHRAATRNAASSTTNPSNAVPSVFVTRSTSCAKCWWCGTGGALLFCELRSLNSRVWPQDGGSADMRSDRFAILYEATRKLQELQQEVAELKAQQAGNARCDDCDAICAPS